MEDMYKSIANSPETKLNGDITISATSITVVTASLLPDAPNICTIGAGILAETIKYTGKSGNTLTGCVRGYDGTAKAWDNQTPVYRSYTSIEHNNTIDNIVELNDVKAPKENPEFTGTVDINGVLDLSDGEFIIETRADDPVSPSVGRMWVIIE